jgi:hypothetical protein
MYFLGPLGYKGTCHNIIISDVLSESFGLKRNVAHIYLRQGCGNPASAKGCEWHVGAFFKFENQPQGVCSLKAVCLRYTWLGTTKKWHGLLMGFFTKIDTSSPKASAKREHGKQP